MTTSLETVDTILVSDIHLGSPVSRAKVLLELLKRYSFRRLILLGDVFDNLNFRRLQKDHWELLSYLRTLSDPESNVEIVWVLGNHDFLLENFSYFLGVEATHEYTWDAFGIKHYAIHGHQFDGFLRRNKLFSFLAANFYLGVQRVGGHEQRFARFLKKLSKGWLRLSKQVAENAMARAKSLGAKRVFCGHTHRPLVSSTGDITYYNTGAWTTVPAHYIVIHTDGSVEPRQE